MNIRLTTGMAIDRASNDTPTISIPSFEDGLEANHAFGTILYLLKILLSHTQMKPKIKKFKLTRSMSKT